MSLGLIWWVNGMFASLIRRLMNPVQTHPCRLMVSIVGGRLSWVQNGPQSKTL